MSPRNNACNHPNCYGLPCKMLTDEELQPAPEWALRSAPAGCGLYEEITLTVRQFKAYKDLTRAAWRKEVNRVMGR